ncbi:MAG TPA: hypothetical protein VE035_02400 [Puia sp.]|nr:hypothetical protein [Puia sp.]
MSNPAPKKINIFLSVDQQAINNYFNAHDPAPIYKRQLSHEFEQYIMNSIFAAKRHSAFNYKVCCKNETDNQYVEPLLYAIKGHFWEKKLIRDAAFEKFKRRTYSLLFVSLAVVMICHGFLPLLLKGENSLNAGLSNSMDIFSWVILWQPIDKLIFHWNPYLKDISVMNRLAKAEVIIIENAS